MEVAGGCPVNSDLKKEIRGRTLKLDAYERERNLLDRLEARLIRLFNQKHEVVRGRRITLTRRRKVAKANAIIDKALEGEIDVNRDSIDQVKLMDGDQ